MTRVLLTTVFRPFCVDSPLDSAKNQVQHGTCHRQFTREQGVFTIHQQCSHVALHLIAANLEAEVDVLEYPSLGEIDEALSRAVQEERPYDFVGISTVACYLRKARVICERVRALSPRSRTVLGGGGVMALPTLMEPFSDYACRGDGVAFFRQLLGQDPDAPIVHPSVWSVHRPNVTLGWEGNIASYSLAVSLGCHRGCAFCSTSAQFGGQRQPVLGSAEAILAVMRRVDQELRAKGRRRGGLYFMIFDENFLSDEALARDFLARNRRELAAGRAYLPFLFADAQSVSRFTPEELLEMGVDALWIGMETTPGDGVRPLPKVAGVDFRVLVQRLQAHGLKVFVSFIAGLEEQTKRSIEADIEYALSLGAAGYQYAIACPMPGTPLWRDLEARGVLAVERPEQINMSHYYMKHPEFDEDYLRAKTIEFQHRDYHRHGPLALRYLEMRLRGHLLHRASTSPALRTRAREFRNDILDASGALALGPIFAPTPEIRRRFVQLRRDSRRSIRLLSTVRDLAAGNAPFKGFCHFLLFSNRVLSGPAGFLVSIRTLRADPRSRERCRTLLGFLRHRRACIEEVRDGMMPWDQPVLVVTRYRAGQRLEEAPVGRKTLKSMFQSSKLYHALFS